LEEIFLSKRCRKWKQW